MDRPDDTDGRGTGSDEPNSRVWTVPNLLSFGRLAATPVLVWLILAEQRLAAVLLLGAMGWTDYFDGYIARRTGQVSELGILLDPVGDRVLIMAMLIAMMFSGDMPVWLGAPVLARDALLSIVFLLLSRRGFGRPKVRRVGKTATFALLFGLPAILSGDWAGGVLHDVGIVVFAVGAVLYYVAAFRYAQDVRAWMQTQQAPFA